MAKVEDAAEIAFALVGGHDFAFDTYGVGDEAVDDGGVLLEDGVGSCVADVEERLVADHATFDDFIESRAVFSRRQRGDDFWIDEDRERLVEGTEEILAGGEVYAGFAANGRVDLGEEGRRDLNHRHASHERRGEESGDVGDDAAAEADDDAGTVRSGVRHLAGEGFHFTQTFAVFAARKEEWRGV